MRIFWKTGNWVIKNEFDGTFIELEGSKNKALNMFNHIKAISTGSRLYRNGELVAK